MTCSCATINGHPCKNEPDCPEHGHGPHLSRRDEGKVYKYGTGEIIPEGAAYLTTLVEVVHGRRFVWHYFFVSDSSSKI